MPLKRKRDESSAASDTKKPDEAPPAKKPDTSPAKKFTKSKLPVKPITTNLERKEKLSRIDFATGEHWYAIAKREYDKDKKLDRIISVEVIEKKVPVKKEYPIRILFNWTVARFQKVLNDADLPYQEGKYAIAYERLGYALCFLGQYARAIAKLTEATAQYPKSAALWCCIGNAYHHNGQYNEALTAYNKALAADKYFPRTYGFMAELFDDKNSNNPHQKHIDVISEYTQLGNYDDPALPLDKQRVPGSKYTRFEERLITLAAQGRTNPPTAPRTTATARKAKVKTEMKAPATAASAAASAAAADTAAAKPKKSPSVPKAKPKDSPSAAAFTAAAAMAAPAPPPPAASTSSSSKPKPQKSVKDLTYLLRQSSWSRGGGGGGGAAQPAATKAEKPKRTPSRSSPRFFKSSEGSDDSHVASPSSASPPDAYTARVAAAAEKRRIRNADKSNSQQIKSEDSLRLHLTQTDDEATQPIPRVA